MAIRTYSSTALALAIAALALTGTGHAQDYRPLFCKYPPKNGLTAEQEKQCGVGEKQAENKAGNVDPDTGLEVEFAQSDQNWNSNPNPPVPLSKIVKLTSGFDGSKEYAVFDKNWLRSSCLPLWDTSREWRSAFTARN